jgi:hypothetical protein
MTTQVRSFMLCTGQELIAELVKATGTGYDIKNPLVVHLMRGPDGQPSLGFAPWSMLHKTGPGAIIPLFDHALLAAPVEVLNEVEASYLTNVSGILVPPAANGGKILLG